MFDEERGSDSSQNPVDGIEEQASRFVVLQSEPFALEYTPERLRYVESRRVLREG